MFYDKGITCGYPAGINNGGYHLVNGSVNYLSQVVYSCEEGYDMVGRARLVCDIDERWNGPPPRCEPILCHSPPEIPNGRFTTTNNITIAGTVIEYSCNSRKYKLIGPKKIICLPIGQYDKPPPICQEEPAKPIIGPIGVINKATPKPTTRPARPPIITKLPPPFKPDDEGDEDLIHRPTKLSTVKAPIDVTKKSFVTPTPRPQPVRTTEPRIPQVTAGHPLENEIPDNVLIRSDVQPNANIPSSVEEDRRETSGARLNLGKRGNKMFDKISMLNRYQNFAIHSSGAIISLGVFGGFVFLAAVVTTIVILIRR